MGLGGAGRKVGEFCQHRRKGGVLTPNADHGDDVWCLGGHIGIVCVFFLWCLRVGVGVGWGRGGDKNKSFQLSGGGKQKKSL